MARQPGRRPGHSAAKPSPAKVSIAQPGKLIVLVSSLRRVTRYGRSHSCDRGTKADSDESRFLQKNYRHSAWIIASCRAIC